MNDEIVLELSIPPSAALTRIAGAINQRPKRAFGVVKTQNEFVGKLSPEGFDIWERRARAVHAVGRVTAVTKGTRVELRFVLPRLNRVLLVVFFTLYALLAGGIALQPPDQGVSPAEFLIAASGAVALGLVFYGTVLRQRRDLARFLTTVLSTSPI